MAPAAWWALPTKPFSPNRLKLCAIGLLCGLLLGTVTVAGAEIVDERIYSEKDFKKLVPAAVLAEIPSISTGEELEKHHLQARLKWIAAGLMFTVILAGSALSYFKA